MTDLQTMAARAAADLIAIMARQDYSPTLYAVPTNETTNGRLVAVGQNEPGLPAPAIVIRPCDCGASTFTRWSACSIHDLAHIIAQASRAAPILPIHPEEA
jgi:hypothetical protein